MSDWKNEDGFTIQELLVVLVVGSILVGFGLSLYRFVSRASTTGLRDRRHVEAVQRAVLQIGNDLAHASRIRTGNGAMTMENTSGLAVIYTFQREGILRNGVPLSVEEGGLWSAKLLRAGEAEDSTNPCEVISIEAACVWPHDSCSFHTTASIPWSSTVAFERNDTLQVLLATPDGHDEILRKSWD